MPADSCDSSPHLVLIPFKDRGHIAPMMILAEKLVNLQQSLFISVICVEREAHALAAAGGVHPRICLLLLETENHSSKADALQSLLESLKRSDRPPAAVLADIIVVWSKVTIQRCDLPRYVLYTASCTNLSNMFRLKGHPPGHHGHHPGHAGHHPGHHHPRMMGNNVGGQEEDGLPDLRFHDWGEDLRHSEGVLVNTAYELESGEIDMIRSKTSKLVLPIGPLFHLEGEELDPSSCKQWLDDQRPSSVIYISFGSRTYLRKEQIYELATGLERSSQPFLWLLPVPPPYKSHNTEEYLDSVLPEGFRSRKQAGIIISDWAPQKLILRHRSLAAFLTHCGWNSVLECLCLAGKPMLCLPFGADQPFNSRFIVNDLKVGLELDRDQHWVVRSSEVHSKIKALMADKESMKPRLEEVQSRLKAAVEGSSLDNLRTFGKEIGDAHNKIGRRK